MKLLLLFLLLTSINGLKITCKFEYVNWAFVGNEYTCTVIGFAKTGDALKVESYSGNHLSGKSFADVKVVSFESDACPGFNIRIMPKGFQKLFPNFISLRFESCAIDALNSDDLIEYPKLQVFSLWSVPIKNIPKSLFAYSPNLRRIRFENTKVSNNDFGAFNNLPNLVNLHFNGNPCIDQEALTSTAVASLIQKLKSSCPQRIIPNPFCSNSIGSAQEFPLNFVRYSCNKCFKIILQSDGNFVVQQNKSPFSVIWQSNTSNKGVVRGAMEPNGKLKLYSKTAVIWQSSYTYLGNSNAKAVIEDTAEVKIWMGATQKWTSGIIGSCPSETTTTKSTTTTKASTTKASTTKLTTTVKVTATKPTAMTVTFPTKSTSVPTIFDSIELTCTFGDGWWAPFGKVYYCEATDVKYLPGPNNVVKVIGQHLTDRSNDDVLVVSFQTPYCPKFNLTIVPQGLETFFKNIQGFRLYNCDIETLNGNELENYKNLKMFGIGYSKLARVPGSLFKPTPNMEVAYFSYNDIIEVDPGTFDNLPLEQLHFGDNTCINRFADYVREISAVLEDLKANCAGN